ncbi:hypothetical protein Tco_1300073 [Tanacetum coccineum]
MQVLHGFEFKVEPLGDHTFEVEPQENVDQGAGLQEVQTQELMDYQLACDRVQHLACELFGYREVSFEAAFAVAGLKDDMDARSDVYVLSNGCRKCSDDNNGYYWEYTPATKGLLDKAKGNVLGMEIVRDQSGNTMTDTSKVVALKQEYRFQREVGEYQKTFHGSGVGTSSMQVLHGFKFEVEPLGDHTFKVEPQKNVDQGAGLQEVQTQHLMDYQLARDREQHLACELFGIEKTAGLKDDMDARSDVYVLSNGYRKCSDDNNGYYWEHTQAKRNVLGMKIVRDQSGNTLRVSQSRFYNEKLLQTLLEGHSMLSLKDSLSGDCDVKKMEYQVVCTRPDIASADLGMLDGFDRGLQTYVQVFLDFDYAMGISITVMGRYITGYGLMILGCAGSFKANLQHMEALSTTEAGY